VQGKMMLPLHIRNRLRAGRIVSAEIRATHPHHRAWIHVTPIIDLTKGRWVHREHGLEPQLMRHAVTDDPIIGFEVRHRELHRQFEQYPDDWDQIGLVIDETIKVNDEQQLTAVLMEWIDDLSVLGLPHADGSPF
jgi:hypothetical protein